jgi:superfamily I DNA/RNA helicase
MAQLIPDAVPAGKSMGERRLFQRLQDLPDDCLVYYEPIVGNRYPDFVVIMPDAGLLILECKGWRSDQILGGDSHVVRVRSGTEAGEMACPNPIRQARDYKYRLMDHCRAHPLARCLVHPDGPHVGQSMFPFGSCVVLSQLTASQLREHRTGDLRLIMPSEQVVDAEEFDAWAAFTPIQLQQRLRAFFNPTWRFDRLSTTQVTALRTILHPEIMVPPTPAGLASSDQPVQASFLTADGEVPDIKSLDHEQERVARALGNGHRLLFGVAGSGKTVVLVARARLLSEGLPSGAILVLCYNVTFKAYLQAVLRELRNVEVLTFHGWSARNGVRWDHESPEEHGRKLLAHLESGAGEVGAYDAVLIDEAQDFDPTWFSCAMAALKEPRGGDLLIVGDGSQTAYRRGRVSWRSIGISAQGRTKYLTQNYRNSKAIMLAAAPFADDVREEDGIGSAACDPANARRETLQRPLLIHGPSRLEEFREVAAVVKGLLSGTFAGWRVPPLTPSDIGILYRRADGDLPVLISHLAAIAPVLWLTSPDRQGNVDPRQRILEPGIKLQTIHAAKGLQYKAVVLVCADQLGASPADGTIAVRADEEERLMYVALTRPEDYLVVSYTASESRPAPELVRRLVSSGAFRV